MDEAGWHYSQHGQAQGPVSLEGLRAMLRSGQVGWHEIVWTQGMENWAPAGQVAALTEGLPPPIPGNMPVGYAMPRPAAQNDLGQNAGIRMLIPVGRSGWAIAAGYLGLFSILLVPAPIAAIVSVVAIMDLRKHPEQHGMGRAVFGLVMGILGTLTLIASVVIAVIR